VSRWLARTLVITGALIALPVDKPAGAGSGAPPPPLQKKSPARHA
jgi:hypothetical protein